MFLRCFDPKPTWEVFQPAPRWASIFPSGKLHPQTLDNESTTRVRVLRPHGRVHILMTILDGNAGRPGSIRRYADIFRRGLGKVLVGFRRLGVYRTLKFASTMITRNVPKGAMDYFHVYFPKLDEVFEILDEVGLSDICQKKLDRIVLVTSSRTLQ